MYRAPILVAITALIALTPLHPSAAQQGNDTVERSVPAEASIPIFAGELDVNLINVFVTVLDDDGIPVPNLTRDNFAVYERDQPMNITNFSEIRRTPPDRDVVRAGDSESLDARLARVIGDDGGFVHVALLFDRLSLQKRNCKRVLKALEEFVHGSVSHGDRIMVASVGEEFRVLEPFTSDVDDLLRALNEVPDTPSLASETSGRKRILDREILSEQVLQNEAALFSPRGPGGGSSTFASGAMPQSISTDMVVLRATKLMEAVGQLRAIEEERIRRSLLGLHEMVRSLAAVPGSKHVIWIGEDLAIQPAIDTYSHFFSKFQKWSTNLNLERPDMWLSDDTLDAEFSEVATAAQVSRTTLHLVDASDRDRELAASAFSSVENNAFLTSEEGGNRVSADYDLARSARLVDGAAYLAHATGGTFSSNTRDFEHYFEDLEAILGSYYSIGYVRPGDPDGALRPVRIDLPEESARIHHQQQVYPRTPVQKVVDDTLSRLRFGTGTNPLGVSVTLAGLEPIDEGRFIQTIRLGLPVGPLSPIESGQNALVRLLVVFQSLDKYGFSLPPQLMPLDLTIPSARMTQGALAQAEVRLLVGPDTRRLGIGILDQTSGVQATTDVELAPAAP